MGHFNLKAKETKLQKNYVLLKDLTIRLFS